MDNRSDIWRGVDAIKPRFVALSDKVWGMPEVGQAQNLQHTTA